MNKSTLQGKAKVIKEFAKVFAEETINETTSKLGSIDISDKASRAGQALKGAVVKTGEGIQDISHKTKNTIAKKKDDVTGKLDQNGDGSVDIQDIIVIALKTPGVYINRSSFLQKELFKNHPQSVIDKAIAQTPALAGIGADEIDEIANEVIRYERTCVTGISTALGVPGGAAMLATIPADIVQYYGYTLRATQKLLYLYGFPEIDSDEEGLQLDSRTINEIILCLGVMNGVAGANNAIKGMAKALAIGVEKKLLQKALTKGAFYPFVKSVMKWFGVRLTKEIFAGFFKKSIPVIGGFVGGGITYATFKPCCDRLKKALIDTMLSNPGHVSSAEEEKIVEQIIAGEVIDIDCAEIEVESEDFNLEEFDYFIGE